MLQFAEPLGVTSPMICSNGGHVVGPDGSDVHCELLDKDSFEVVLDYVQEVGVHLSVYTQNDLFFLRETSWGEAYAKRVRSVIPQVAPPEVVREKDVLKTLIIDEPDRIPGHVAALAKRLDPTKCRMTESEPEYLEMMPASVSKGAALERLIHTLGISQSRTAAIGDYLNDLEMIQFAGHSAAVGNAAEATKLAADRVVATNEEGGVAEFIHYLLDN